VWGKLTAAGDCPATDGGQNQALWVFSTTACGVYGFEGLTISHDGSTSPAGQITLDSTRDILIRGGSGWLLVVNASASPSGK
jgi:hypothetical protein